MDLPPLGGAKHLLQVAVMDPLSLTASIVAVTTVAVQVTKVLSSLHKDWDSLPGRVHALNNEIQDFTVVLNQVRFSCRRKTSVTLG